MNCPQMIKVSMLLDQELPPDQEAMLRTHLMDCQECRQAWDDFRALRSQMKSAAAEAAGDLPPALERILNPPQPGFWKRRIAVPAPLATAAALMLVALSIWAGTLHIRRQPSLPPVSSAEAPLAAPREGIDLARFDRGERPLIYKQPKPEGRLR